MPKRLTWGLLICSLNRDEEVMRGVKLALTQTRPPDEIVIVHSSPEWEKSKARLEAELGNAIDGIRWRYVGSARGSSSMQRNIALDHSEADIVFLIDDDSLLYPDAAEEVMAVYEADIHNEVAGVTMTEVFVPPDAKPGAESIPRPSTANQRGILARIEHILSEQELRFLPYDGHYHKGKLPETLAGMDVIPQGLLGGFRMTFRSSVIQKVRFAEYLDAYAVGEDFDASYRASRYGALVLACRARIHHLMVPGGRPNRRLKSGFTCLNVIAMASRHAPDSVDLRSQVRRFLAQRLGIALATDVGRRRFSFPDTRGVLFAWRHYPESLARRGKELEDWYLEFQRSHLRR